jgi:phage gpG-like protein
MSDYHIVWHGPEAMDHVRGRAVQFVTRAAIEVQRRAKELLSVAGSGRKKGRKAGPAVHSRPGEPPRKQTGRLRASVTHDVDAASLTARVGTNVEYGKYLELGTKRGIAPRPWLRRALAEMQGRVNELLGGIGE